MTRARRQELERRIIADRKRRPDPAPFTCATRGTRGDHDPMPPPPVYTSREDGPGVRPRVRR